MRGHGYDLRDGYVHTNPLVIGTQIAKRKVLQIHDDTAFSLSHKQESIAGLCECERGNVRLRTGRRLLWLPEWGPRSLQISRDLIV
jgi:hypothetical protein